jgi:hypothetical protein
VTRLPVLASAAAIAGVAVLAGPTATAATPAAAATTASSAAVGSAVPTARATTPASSAHASGAAAVAEGVTTWVGDRDLQRWSGTGASPRDVWYTSTARGQTPAVFGPSGVSFAGAGALLHSTTGSASADLVTTADGADLLSTGTAVLTLVVDLDGDGTATGRSAALMATTPGADGIDGTYVSFTTIGAIPAGTVATLAAFQAQFAAVAPAATISDVGVVNNRPGAAIAPGGPTTITGITVGGTTTYFTPAPTASVTPASVTATSCPARRSRSGSSGRTTPWYARGRRPRPRPTEPSWSTSSRRPPRASTRSPWSARTRASMRSRSSR